MLRRLYDWVLSLAGHRHALWFLAVISFAESSVFPIPPHPLLLLMVIARPERWLLLGIVTSVASVLGGIAGYALGAFLFETVGQPVLEAYGWLSRFDEVAELFRENGIWAVLAGGATPLPYKVVTIASGAVSLDFTLFTLASIASRGGVFMLIAGLVRIFGPPVKAFIEKRLALMTTIFVVLLFAGFLLIRYL
ncbi:MAG: VTT domain-containing protein [Pseudomonadota bacterium]